MEKPIDDGRQVGMTMSQESGRPYKASAATYLVILIFHSMRTTKAELEKFGKHWVYLRGIIIAVMRL